MSVVSFSQTPVPTAMIRESSPTSSWPSQSSYEIGSGRDDIVMQALNRLTLAVADLRRKIDCMEVDASNSSKALDRLSEDVADLRRKRDVFELDDSFSSKEGQAVALTANPEPMEIPQDSLSHRRASNSSSFAREFDEIMDRKMTDALQQSFWDVGLVCGHHVHGLTLVDSAVALCLLMMVAGMNGIICYILVRYFSNSDLDVPAAQKWREEVGHWSKYASIDGQSMVHQMCIQDMALMMSASQSDQYARAKGYYDIVFGAPIGVVLCCWCVLIFLFLIFEEVQKTINRVVTVLHLERIGVTSIMPSGDGFILISLSLRRRIWVLMLCVLRIAVAIIFLYSGSQWLVYTDDIQNLILNSVALVFVLDIDELVYRIACPSSMQAMLEHMEPLRKPPLGPLNLPSRAISTLCGAALVLVLLGTLSLGPFADAVGELKDTFCGGYTNFVIAKNQATGIVYTYHHRAEPQANVNKLMQDIVRQLRDEKPETNHITSPSYQAFESSITATLLESVALFGEQCRDIQPNDPQEAQLAGPLLAALKDAIGISAVGMTDCSQLNFGQCSMDHPIIRLACPVTCGCSSSFHGNFLMSGCPFSRCEVLQSFVSGRQSQPWCDIDQGVLPHVPEWVAYWQSFQGHTPADSDAFTLSNWESSLTRQLLVQKFHQFGCGAFGYFRRKHPYRSIAASIKDFFCPEGQNVKRRSLAIFCPRACACNLQPASGSISSPFCPRPPPANASKYHPHPIACARVYVRNASLLTNSQCKQLFSKWTNMTHPVGWYMCSPNAYNGKNVYTFDDVSNVRWQIRWESVSSYEFGVHRRGQKIGLTRTYKWTLSSVDQSSTFPASECQRPRFFISNSSTELPSVTGWFPRISSNTDVDCAKGDMTTDGADKYFVQPADSTALTCPSGYAAMFQIFYRPLFWDVASRWKEKVRNYTIARCRDAAEALDFPYKGEITDAYGPGGCFLSLYSSTEGRVLLNERESVTNSCSFCHPICMKCAGVVVKSQSECQRFVAIFVASTSGLNVDARLRSSFTCPGSFFTAHDCNMAATALALPDNTSYVGKYVDSPRGCYYNTASRKLYFNEDGFGDCTSLRNCVCQYHVPAYEKKTSGTCAQQITGGLSACSLAAVSLGLSATTAYSDGQTSVSYDPPYCYFEGGILKYNSGGGNTGSCSSTDNCLCETCAEHGTDPYSNPIFGGVCCPVSRKIRETLPLTSSVYCDSNNPNYSKSCWDMRWVCRSQPQYCSGSHQTDVVFHNASLMQWLVGACSGWSYVAAFTYALASGFRHLDLLVNGVTVQSSLSFPASGSQSAWLDKSVIVALAAGSNTIKLLAINSSDAKFNKLTLTKADLTTSLQFAIRALDSDNTSLSDPVSGMILTARPVISHAGHDCWDLDSSYLQYASGAKPSIGQFYTQAMWVYWRLSDSGFRTLFRGNIDQPVIINDGTQELGMFSHRAASFWKSGYNITDDMASWQLVVVTGSGDTAAASTGTSTFYTAAEGASQVTMRGKADRVASGTTFDYVGYPGQGPGKVAAAYQWNRILTFGELNLLLTSGVVADGWAGSLLRLSRGQV